MGGSKNSWVIEVRSFLEEATEEDETTPVSIFSVPKSLSVYNPEAYNPQLISFGPYHHQRPDILEMDRHKLLVAKRVVKSKYNSLTYEQLATRVSKHEIRIRACYGKDFDEMDGETLSWLMSIDALFLVEFLQSYGDHINKHKMRGSSSVGKTMSSYLLNATSGRKIGYDSILRDIFMLENQIPLFVLKKIFNLRCVTAMEDSYNEEILPKLVIGVCRELSPLNILEEEDEDEKGTCEMVNVFQYLHLLDLLYHLIVPRSCKQQDPDHTNAKGDNKNDGYHIYNKDRGIGEEGDGDEEEKSGSKCNFKVNAKEIFGTLWSILSKFNGVLIRAIKAILFSKPLKMLVKLPWKLFSKLPFVSMIGPAMEGLFSGNNNNEASSSKGSGSSQAPTIEEMNVPSITSLHKAGVKFLPTDGSIDTVRFDCKTRKLYLPVVRLDVNSEVILRNLVAYEAMSVSGPLVLARYTEFMNGIIDTAEDAKLLRKKKIIVNRLKTDKEVADMWNGMSSSVTLTKVKFLDEAIDGVNTYYEGTWRVKGYKFMKSAIFGSWEVLLVLATILLLSLMALQAFCSVYSCPRLFNLPTGNDISD